MNYSQSNLQLYGRMVSLKDQLEVMEHTPQTEEWIRRIEAQKKRLENQTFTVAVLGEFKRGKSSIVNTLLGARVLPTDTLPATAVINRVVYGEQPQAELRFKDGHQEKIAIDELAHYVTKINDEAEINAARVEEALIHYPSLFCMNGVELIDTPGFNDSDLMKRTASGCLERVDVALVAVSCLYPLSITEAELIAHLAEESSVLDIIVVLTMIDRLSTEERDKVETLMRARILRGVSEKLSACHDEDDPVILKWNRMADSLKIYGVSSTQGMCALQTNDMDLFEQSGYKRLNKELPLLLMQEKNRSVEQSTRSLVEEIEYGVKNQKRHEALGNRLQMVQHRFAELAYDAVNQEEEAFQTLLKNRLIGIKNTERIVGSTLDACWKNAGGSSVERAGSVIKKLGDIYLEANHEAQKRFGERFGEALGRVSQTIRKELLQKLEQGIQTLPKMLIPEAQDLARRCARNAGTNVSGPKPFYLTRLPKMEDVITFDPLNKPEDVEAHPFMVRVHAMVKQSFETFIKANEAQYAGETTEIVEHLRMDVQTAVMDFFKLCKQADQVTCGHCGHVQEAGTAFCGCCGESIPETLQPDILEKECVLCPFCGQPQRTDERFCPNCGKPVSVWSESLLKKPGEKAVLEKRQTEAMPDPNKETENKAQEKPERKSENGTEERQTDEPEKPLESQFCKVCGEKLMPGSKRCWLCGNEIE